MTSLSLTISRGHDLEGLVSGRRDTEVQNANSGQALLSHLTHAPLSRMSKPLGAFSTVSEEAQSPRTHRYLLEHSFLLKNAERGMTSL